jgi:hypothetical protein
LRLCFADADGGGYAGSGRDPDPCSRGDAAGLLLPPAGPERSPQPMLDSKLVSRVSDAVDMVIRTQPQLFDFNDARGDSLRVLDRQKYQTAVVAAINAQGGICAKDDNEEIAAKVSNDYNEQFNIWTSAGYTRRSYISTCFPAQF